MHDDELRPASVRVTGLVTTAWQRREVRFLVVGGANTVLGYVIFVVFHALVGDSVPYLALLVPTYSIGVPIAFATQRILVFDTHGKVWLDFARYCLVQLGGIAMNAATLAIMVEALGLPVVAGQTVALVIVVVLTYFSHLLFSFRRPAPTATDPAQ